MHDITYDLTRLAERHREGSYATQANRKSMLRLFGEQLWELGYRAMRAHELKGRHVNKLLAHWRTQGLSPATIHNRLSVLRWWSEKVDKAGVLAKSNAGYGLPARPRTATTSKAVRLPVDQLGKIPDAFLRMSLRLQRAFGLRREESIKIKPWQADQGTMLVLQGSWTKGGRPREIPIRTEAQRALLEEAKALVRLHTASLIPADKRYVEQLKRYEYWTAKVGLSRMHGLRHAYCHDRYVELTGFPCPVAGGPVHAALTPQQREADVEAREIISAELGHGRIQIVAAYIG